MTPAIFKSTLSTGLVLVALFTHFVSYGQGKLTPTRLHANDLSKEISHTGQVKAAFRWQDRSGDNIAFISETGEFKHKLAQGDNRDAILDAGGYVLKNGSLKRNWRLYDFVEACPFDISAGFFEDAFQITDLDNNGIAEVWLMYQLACRSDVSPAEMKIVMHQGKKKYAVRGHNRVRVSENEHQGGDFSFDNAFLNGPKEFREYAKQLWAKHLDETWR